MLRLLSRGRAQAQLPVHGPVFRQCPAAAAAPAPPAPPLTRASRVTTSRARRDWGQPEPGSRSGPGPTVTVTVLSPGPRRRPGSGLNRGSESVTSTVATPPAVPVVTVTSTVTASAAAQSALQVHWHRDTLCPAREPPERRHRRVPAGRRPPGNVAGKSASVRPRRVSLNSELSLAAATRQGRARRPGTSQRATPLKTFFGFYFLINGISAAE